MNILDIDMGNTRMKWRYSTESEEAKEASVGACDYLDERFGELLACGYAPERIRISSVVNSDITKTFCRIAKEVWGLSPQIAQVEDICAGVRQGYQYKERLGVDRWLCLLAAFNQVGACVVVSCGSAVTVDVVNDEGRHLGGYIVPGLRLQRESLFQGTHAVKVETNWAFADLAPARDTQDAVNKGSLVMIRGLIDYATQQLSGENPIKILITGGDGETVQRFLPSKTVYNPTLVFDGLAIALP